MSSLERRISSEFGKITGKLKAAPSLKRLSGAAAATVRTSPAPASASPVHATAAEESFSGFSSGAEFFTGPAGAAGTAGAFEVNLLSPGIAAGPAAPVDARAAGNNGSGRPSLIRAKIRKSAGATNDDSVFGLRGQQQQAQPHIAEGGAAAANDSFSNSSFFGTSSKAAPPVAVAAAPKTASAETNALKQKANAALSLLARPSIYHKAGGLNAGPVGVASRLPLAPSSHSAVADKENQPHGNGMVIKARLSVGPRAAAAAAHAATNGAATPGAAAAENSIFSAADLEEL